MHSTSSSARNQQNLLDESLNPDTVIRILKHERDFLIVANSTVQDKRLSWEARGLLVYLLSLPSDWQIKVSHLQKQGGAGRDVLRRMLRELQEFGYVSGFGRESRDRAERGNFVKTEIQVYETPSLNPEYSGQESPAPEIQSSVDQPSPDLPATGSPAPENPSPYKEHSPQNTQGTNHTHKQTELRAVGAPAVVVGADSKFSLEDCRRYANNLHASGQGVSNPGGFARSIHRSGAEDANIELFLHGTTPAQARARDIAQCPDCEGSTLRPVAGPGDYSKGVMKCGHERLDEQGAA
jgi:hypothetical protein